MEEIDLLSMFKSMFPDLYRSMDSFEQIGDDVLHICSKDGSKIEFQILPDGVSLKSI